MPGFDVSRRRQVAEFELPAVCPRDGAVFGSGFAVGGEGSVTMQGGKAGPCPVCGGWGEVPDGFYKLLGDTLEVVASSGYSRAQIGRVIKILEGVRTGEPDPDHVAEALKAEAPEIANVVSRLLKPKNAGEFYALIAVLLMVLTILHGELATSPKAPSPTAEMIAKAITEVQQNPRATVPPQSAPAPPAPPIRPGRNDPCPCGSGLKFKRCHGQPHH